MTRRYNTSYKRFRRTAIAPISSEFTCTLSFKYKYSNLHEIYYLIDTLASEVKCLRVIKKSSKQRALIPRARYKADPEKKASVRDSYKADPEKKASVRDSYKADPEKKASADPEKKKASVRDSYEADPEKKKASVRDSYKADPEKKKASVRDSYNADIESKQSAKWTSRRTVTGILVPNSSPLLDTENFKAFFRIVRFLSFDAPSQYLPLTEKNRAAKRPKYEDNSAAIKASERNRYWNDPAVRLAKRAAERKRYRMCHRTTTTTQSYSLYEPKSHALMEYNGGLENAILRDSELLSEVNDAFYAVLPPYRPPPAVATALPPPPPPAAAELPPPPPPAAESCPHRQQQQQQSYPRGSGIAGVTELPLPPKAAALPPPPPAVAAELPHRHQQKQEHRRYHHQPHHRHKQY
eukprot:Em0002g1029a